MSAETVKEKYKVSEDFVFQVLEKKQVSGQELCANVQPITNPRITWATLRPMNLDRVQEIVSQLNEMKNSQPLSFKLLQLRNISKVSEVGLISDTYGIRLTNDQVQRILKMIS